MQEKHQVIEQMREAEESLHTKLGRMHEVHYKNKIEYLDKIAEVDLQLQLIQKRKKTLNTEGSNTTLEDLKELSKKIKEVYREVGFVQDLNNKEPLEILNVSDCLCHIIAGTGARRQQVD